MAQLNTEEEYITSSRLKQVLARQTVCDERLEECKHMIRWTYATLIWLSLITIGLEAGRAYPHAMPKLVFVMSAVVGGFIAHWIFMTSREIGK